MLKTFRTYISALKEKKSLNRVKLYDTTGNNPIELDPSSRDVQKLQELSDTYRRVNLKIYTQNMAKITGKKVLLISPFIVGALAITSFLHGKYIKSIPVYDVYEEKTIEFDENSVISESSIINVPTGLFFSNGTFNRDYVDERVKPISYVGIENNFDKSSYVTIYYGKGSDSLQVKFTINDDNTWEYTSHTNNLYQKVASDRDNLKVDENFEYKKLIADVTETFIKQAELTDDEVALLRELVSNNENDIIVTIRECVNLGDQYLEVHRYHWFRCLLLVVAEIALILFIINNIEDIINVERLEDEDGRLNVRYLNSVNLLKAAKNYREGYLESEQNRLSEIIDILRFNNCDEKVMAEYQKRLSIIKK